jgi:hypothetical protein
MNIKLHTPKSLKKGSGMATMKQFMLSLLATTVSIALTFGTAAVVDKNKKENEKHQILLMVLCDMKTSMDEINEVDSMIGKFVEDQAMYLANPDSFDTSGYLLSWNYIEMDYNRTVENIFNSNIESINTIGNINFVEKASDFYKMREYYNENVTKQFSKMVTGGITDNYDSLANVRDTAEELRFVSAVNARIISQNYRACRMLTNVSDKELDEYHQNRTKLEKATKFNDEEKAFFDSMIQVRRDIKNKLDKAYEEGKSKNL